MDRAPIYIMNEERYNILIQNVVSFLQVRTSRIFGTHAFTPIIAYSEDINLSRLCLLEKKAGRLCTRPLPAI